MQHRSHSQKLVVFLRYVLSGMILLALWFFAVKLFAIKPFILPDPFTVIQTIVAEWERYLDASLITLRNVALGAALGISLGVLVGVSLAYSRILRWIIEPYLTIFQSFPREALSPLFVVWFGFGLMTKMVNATMLSFLPMALITLAGVTNVRKDYLELIRSWGANKWQEFLHCRIPAAVPQIVAGIRVAIPLAIIGAVLAEFAGGNNGLGYIIISSGSTFRIDRLFGAVLILALTGLCVHASINLMVGRFYKRFFEE